MALPLAFLAAAFSALSPQLFILFPDQNCSFGNCDREISAAQVWLSSGTVVLAMINAVVIVPALALTARRLHDTNRTAHHLWYAISPVIGTIVLMVYAARQSDPAGHRFDRLIVDSSLDGSKTLRANWDASSTLHKFVQSAVLLAAITVVVVASIGFSRSVSGEGSAPATHPWSFVLLAGYFALTTWNQLLVGARRRRIAITESLIRNQAATANDRAAATTAPLL